jgi:hypothetical protein
LNELGVGRDGKTRRVPKPKRRRGKRMSDDYTAEPQHDRDLSSLQAVWGNSCETARTAFLEWEELDAEPIDPVCEDCDSPEEFWRLSFLNHAGDAGTFRAYWSRQFGDWQNFEMSSDLVTLAEQAAEEWRAIASTLCARLGQGKQ